MSSISVGKKESNGTSPVQKKKKKRERGEFSIGRKERLESEIPLEMEKGI